MSTIQTLLSPGGQQHTFGNSTPNEMLVGTLEGVAKLEKIGNDWKITNRSLPESHVGQIILELVSGKIFAGCHAGGGLWVNDETVRASHGASLQTELIAPTFMLSQSET